MHLPDPVYHVMNKRYRELSQKKINSIKKQSVATLCTYVDDLATRI